MTTRHLLFLLARRLYAFGPPTPAVLIMGHMRCGSTLLLHILIDNRELIGCGERNAPYGSHLDLDKLVVQSRLAQRAPFRRVRYAVDQVNHDRFTPDRDLLSDPRVRLIFLSRDPLPTIQSILELSRRFYGGTWTAETAVDYYCQRLQTLAEIAVDVEAENRAMATTYEAFVHDTAAVLRRLDAFLDVDDPFRGRYKTQRFTGTRGDPSETIRTGHIVKRRIEYRGEVPRREMERAAEAHQAYRRAISSLEG